MILMLENVDKKGQSMPILEERHQHQTQGSALDTIVYYNELKTPCEKGMKTS